MPWHTGDVVRSLLKERGERTEVLMDWLGVSRPTAYGLLRREQWSDAYRQLAGAQLGVTADWLDHGDGDAPDEPSWEERADVQAAVRRAEDHMRVAMQAALVQLRDELGRIATEHTRGRLTTPAPQALQPVPLDERRLTTRPELVRGTAPAAAHPTPPARRRR